MNNLNRRVAQVTALAVVAALTYVLWPRSEPVRVTAYFPRTVGIYPGSDVRVLGVRIGEVEKITPEGDRVRVELEYEAGRRVPADARAAIINSSVVSDRYVQLLPVYRGVRRCGAVTSSPSRARPYPSNWTASSTACTPRPSRSAPRGRTRTARCPGCSG